MPTLIERQTACMAKFAGPCRIAATSFKGISAVTPHAALIKRKHAEELMAAGYPKDQAWASAAQCYQMAALNAMCDYDEGVR